MTSLGNALLGALLGHTEAEKLFRCITKSKCYRFSFAKSDKAFPDQLQQLFLKDHNLPLMQNEL